MDSYAAEFIDKSVAAQISETDVVGSCDIRQVFKIIRDKFLFGKTFTVKGLLSNEINI